MKRNNYKNYVWYPIKFEIDYYLENHFDYRGLNEVLH